MFSGPGWKIGRVMGIPIYVSWTWFFIFVLITVTLATQFASDHPGWTPTEHWAVGIIASLLFFGSVLFHELGHSAVALRYKIKVVSITLFIFGGMARIASETKRPIEEFNIAIAGPLASFLLAAIFFGLAQPFAPNSMIAATCVWLWEINALLGAFNLVPGMPLDGGRILRAIMWAKTKDFNRATQLASRSGQLLAYLLILSGSIKVLTRAENGREIVLYRLGDGDSCVLTTSCLFGNARYPAEGISETDVIALAIPAEKFHQAIQQSKAFREFVFGSFSSHLGSLISLVEEIAFGKLDIRLARHLLKLSTDTTTLETTHQQLATELGSAREVISRQLKDFESRGWVRLHRGSVEILDKESLEELSGL